MNEGNFLLSSRINEKNDTECVNVRILGRNKESSRHTQYADNFSILVSQCFKNTISHNVEVKYKCASSPLGWDNAEACSSQSPREHQWD